MLMLDELSVMALKLYRRHRKECEGGHPEDSRTGEFGEGRRGWKRCAIHAAGTLGGKFNRKQTGKSRLGRRESHRRRMGIGEVLGRSYKKNLLPSRHPAMRRG